VSALAAVACWLVAARRLDPDTSAALLLVLASVVAVTVTSGIAAYRLGGRSIQRLAVTPFALAAVTWLVLFVLRPLELYVWPDHAATSILQFGFGSGELVRAVAIAGLGAAGWCVGYVLVLALPRRERGTVTGAPLRVSGRGATVALALGTLLWGLLFLRQGGPSALIHEPVSIRVNQGSSFYGFVGLWIVQGTALYALVSVLQGGGRAAKRVLLAAAALSFVAGLALQLRGLFAVAVIGGAAIYVALRPIRRRHAAVALVVCLVGVFAFGVAQQVRAYTNAVPTGEAIRLTAHTPLSAMYVSDLSTYDNLVAIQMLVPGSLDYLDGETLVDIPEALVPRAVWPEKPVSIDLQVGALLYPGVSVGIPISMQGELYWNGGLPLVLFGALVIGLALGALARWGLGAAPGVALVVYAAVFPFTHALLTRSFAAGFQNVVFAVLGVGVAVVALDPARVRAFGRRLADSVPAAVPRVDRRGSRS
jgi:hypothetical protein